MTRQDEDYELWFSALLTIPIGILLLLLLLYLD